MVASGKWIPPKKSPASRIDWAGQQHRWEGRVKQRGPEGAIYHVGHRPEEFQQLTLEQGELAFRALEAYMVTAPMPFGPVMDYGCGAGRWTRLLADRYQLRTIGIDLTPSLLAYAVTQTRNPLAEYHPLGHHGKIPLASGSVSLIWAWTTLSAITDPRMLAVALEEWRRVLAPGGTVALIDNTSKVGGGKVRSPHSVSRTVAQYQQLCLPWCPLTPAADFVDLGEINTVLLGRKVEG